MNTKNATTATVVEETTPVVNEPKASKTTTKKATKPAAKKKATGPKEPSKAEKIRAMIKKNPDITIVDVIAKLADKGIACRRSEVISASNAIAE